MKLELFPTEILNWIQTFLQEADNYGEETNPKLREKIEKELHRRFAGKRQGPMTPQEKLVAKEAKKLAAEARKIKVAVPEDYKGPMCPSCKSFPYLIARRENIRYRVCTKIVGKTYKVGCGQSEYIGEV